MRFKHLPRGRANTPITEDKAPRALWSDPANVAEKWQYEEGKVFLGRTEQGEFIGFDDNRHLLTVAGSRAGKGQSAILPNLALYPGSVVVLDPKGENATLTAERRGQGRGVPAGGLGHEVYVIDPFGVADVADDYRASFNPIAMLDPRAATFVDDCDSIADALVIAAADAQNDFWNSSARMVLRGLVAWVAASPTVTKRDLVEVRRLLFLPPEDEDEKDREAENFDNLIVEMMDADEVGYGVPTETAAALAGMAERERANVLSTVRSNITFMSSPKIAAMFEGGERMPDLAAWKFGQMSIFLCLPATRLKRHARFFRVFINQLMVAVESKRKTGKHPALMILDEMHVLGHMAMLETAAGLIAGYGVRIWSIWQDFSQLEDIYNKRWQTFVGNASLIQAFGMNDLQTLRYISERLGQTSTMSSVQNEQTIKAAATGFSGESKSVQLAPLLTPDEIAGVFSRQNGTQLLIFSGADPIFLYRVMFYDSLFDKYKVEK